MDGKTSTPYPGPKRNQPIVCPYRQTTTEELERLIADPQTTVQRMIGRVGLIIDYKDVHGWAKRIEIDDWSPADELQEAFDFWHKYRVVPNSPKLNVKNQGS